MLLQRWLIPLFLMASLWSCTSDNKPSSSSSGSGGQAQGGGAAQGGTPVGGGGTIGPGPAGPDAVIIQSGDPDKILLQGLVLTPDQSFAGEVLIVGSELRCVATSCADDPNAAAASVVQTNGIIMPGMIDTHNHVLFNIFDGDDWTPSQAYENHHQWPNEARYGAMLDTKQYLNGESGSPINLNCELNKYGEIKALVAGTTAIVGGSNPGNKICYRTLARTIDQTANGLCGTVPPQSCPDNIQVNTIFPSGSSANSICDNFNEMKTNAYVVHIGEGVDESSRAELNTLNTISTPDGCLYDSRTTIVHGTAFGDAEFTILSENGMGLSWSPRSNVSLYGAGTDLTKTTDIPLALSKSITVALSPDWSMGGSPNLLDELRFANTVNTQQWGSSISAEQLVEMVTANAASVLGLADQIGRLQAGMKADVTVFGGDTELPYQSLFAATPREIRLVIIDGIPLYGDDQLAALAPQTPGCENTELCGRSKFLCAATDGGTSSNKFAQTFSDIETALSDALQAYDDLDLSAWDFSPLTPIVSCN